MSIEEALPLFEEVLKANRHRWTLAYYPWEDLAQDMRARLVEKFHTYNQEKPFKPWAIQLVCNYIKNELRNRYYIYQPPCKKCDMFLGEGQCKLYGEVSEKCKLYKKFMDIKGNAANVNFPVSYEQSNYDAAQDFSCTTKEFAASLYSQLSGVHQDIFKLFFESGFSTTKIARNVQISGMNFKERFTYVETSLKTTLSIAKDTIQDKKISMGLD